MRRNFDLPEKDREHLDALGLPWETIVDRGQWLLIHDVCLPIGFTPLKAIEALLIPPNYDDAQIDMVYFFPALARADGKPINALTSHALDGKSFQRWSRHREEPWRKGIDDVGTHLVLINEWLLREFRLR